MPHPKRENRGGRRTGTPGKAYANRGDLNPGAALPAAAATGQQYGKAGRQMAAQQVVPLRAPAAPAPGGTAAAAGPVVPPGSLGPLDAPTDRPGEPLTAGIGLGPGPGPEALPNVGTTGDADLGTLAPYLPTLELLANQPAASMATRNFVRRVRGAMPLTERSR